jgi:hypothetical protein
MHLGSKTAALNPKALRNVCHQRMQVQVNLTYNYQSKTLFGA